MSDAVDVDNDHEGEVGDESADNLKKNPHKHDSGAADLERVTDFVEEEELASHLTQSAMSTFLSKQTKPETSQGQIKDSQKVVIRKEDIELIANEMEVTKQVAEKKLRQYNGNVKEALKSMLAV